MIVVGAVSTIYARSPGDDESAGPSHHREENRRARGSDVVGSLSVLESHLQPRLQSLHARQVHAPFWAAMLFEGQQLVPSEMVLAAVPRQSERHQGRLNWERVSLAKMVHRVRHARTNAERVPVARFNVFPECLFNRPFRGDHLAAHTY